MRLALAKTQLLHGRSLSTDTEKVLRGEGERRARVEDSQSRSRAGVAKMDGARPAKPQAGGLTVPRSRASAAASSAQGNEGSAKVNMGGHAGGDKPQREYAEAMRVALAREVRS